MVVTKSFSAGPMALEIEGQFACWLNSLAGGVPYGVVVETTSGSGPIDKSIAEVKYDDIVITCGVAEPALADWLVKFLKGQAPIHDGAIVFFDQNQNALRRLEWDKGLIVSVTLPALDAALKESVRLTITIRPETTRSTTGPSAAVPAGKTNSSKSIQAGNFSLAIPGVNCAQVGAIEALTISQSFVTPTSGRGAPKPGPLQVGDLVATVLQVGAAGFRAWNDDFLIRGNNGAAQEKSATIRYLAPNLKTEIFSVNLKSVGIYRLDPGKQGVTQDAIPRMTASMYCEEAEIVFPAPEAAPTTPAASATDGPNDLRGFLGMRLEAEDVSRRLRETRDQPLVTSEADRQRRLGVDLGVAWAERRGSLAELEELAAIGDDWSSIVLPPGHSLSEVLVATGVVPVHYDGELELWRDSVVEGLLAGIVQVLSEVSSDVTSNLK